MATIVRHTVNMNIVLRCRDWPCAKDLFIFIKDKHCALTVEAAVVHCRLAMVVMSQRLCNRRRSRILRMVTVRLPCNLSKKKRM